MLMTKCESLQMAFFLECRQGMVLEQKGNLMSSGWVVSPEQIQAAFRTPQKQNVPYRVWYPFLEALFLAQAAGKKQMRHSLSGLDALGVQTRWDAGFPLLQRWEFPLDIDVADGIFRLLLDCLPLGNEPLRLGHAALSAALTRHPEEHREIWTSFLQHELEPWEAWIEAAECGAAPLVFWGQSMSAAIAGMDGGTITAGVPPGGFLATGILPDVWVTAGIALSATRRTAPRFLFMVRHRMGDGAPAVPLL